jgi:hypothetical protein
MRIQAEKERMLQFKFMVQHCRWYVDILRFIIKKCPEISETTHQIANALKWVMEEGNEVKKEHILGLFRWLRPKEYTAGVLMLLRKLVKDLEIETGEIQTFMDENGVTEPSTLAT